MDYRTGQLREDAERTPLLILMKNLGFKLVTFSLLISCAVGARAESAVEMPAAQSDAFPVLMYLADRGGNQDQGEMRRADEQGYSRNFRLPDNSGFGASPDNYAARGSGNDQQSRQGRMSPEERRTLRRQINEAGHDIYAPRR